MQLARTSIESVTLSISAETEVVDPPEVSVGAGTASPGANAQWVAASWSEPGTEATLQIAGVDAPESPALRMVTLGHNYLYVRFGTVIRKAVGVVEVR